MKNYHWAILCAVVAGAVAVFVVLQEDTRCLKPVNIGCRGEGEIVQKVKIGGGVFVLRVARTEGERERGLGGTPALAQNEGMLFEFPQDGFHAIWMKDMLIPIDIIWLSVGGEVVDAREKVSPDSFPAVFIPKSPAHFVVELPAGSAKVFDMRVGSRAKFFPK